MNRNIDTIPLEYETVSQIRLLLLSDQAKGDGKTLTSAWLVEARDEIEYLREQVFELNRLLFPTKSNQVN